MRKMSKENIQQIQEEFTHFIRSFNAAKKMILNGLDGLLILFNKFKVSHINFHSGLHP